MQVKLIEIRDKGTFIPAIAVRLFVGLDNPGDIKLLRRAGYGTEQLTGIGLGVELRCPTCKYTIGAELAKGLIERNPSGLRCPNTGHEEYLKQQPGVVVSDNDPYIMLTSLRGGVACEFDPFEWGDRTWSTVHQWLVANWRKVKSGDVVDVEFILGETLKPKASECIG